MKTHIIVLKDNQLAQTISKDCIEKLLEHNINFNIFDAITGDDEKCINLFNENKIYDGDNYVLKYFYTNYHLNNDSLLKLKYNYLI